MSQEKISEAAEPHTLELSERELGLVRRAFEIARDEMANRQWRWCETQYADRLYCRLVSLWRSR